MTMVRQEVLCQRKTPMTPSGNEPATFRLVAQYLSQLRHHVPSTLSSGSRAQRLFKTHSNKLGHNKRTYVVVSTVQNFTGFVLNDVHKYNIV